MHELSKVISFQKQIVPHASQRCKPILKGQGGTHSVCVRAWTHREEAQGQTVPASWLTGSW